MVVSSSKCLLEMSALDIWASTTGPDNPCSYRDAESKRFLGRGLLRTGRVHMKFSLGKIQRPPRALSRRSLAAIFFLGPVTILECCFLRHGLGWAAKKRDKAFQFQLAVSS